MERRVDPLSTLAEMERGDKERRDLEYSEIEDEGEMRDG